MIKDKLMITILSFVVIGVLGFGTFYYLSSIKPLQNEVITTTTTTTTTTTNQNEIPNEVEEKIISLEGEFSGINNLFEYTTFTWIINENGSVTLSGTVKNISQKKMLMSVNLKLYDQNKNLLGEYLEATYEQMIQGNDLWEEMALTPNDTMIFTTELNDEILNDNKKIIDVRYISFEDINVIE